MQQRPQLLIVGTLALALVTGACTSPAPSRPPPASTANGESESATPSPSASEFELAIHDIPHDFTTPALEFVTDGDALLWSSGVADGSEFAPDLWRFVPGDDQPMLLYANPLRDSSLVVIVGDGAGSYAFVEQNYRAFPPAGWRLWYLPSGDSPVVVDNGDLEQGLLPFLALTPERLVWTAIHETPDGLKSEVLMATPPRGEPVILQAGDPLDVEFLFPSLDEDQLVYSTLTPRPDGGGTRSDVYLLDLESPEPEPLRLNAEDDAFMGVVHGDTVVWLRPTRESPLNGGSLMRYSLSEGTSRAIQLSADQGMLNYHTIGNRYVAADSELLTRLYLYDLQTDQSVLVEDLGDAPEGSREAVNVRPRVAGDLLVFVRGSDNLDAVLTLRWAQLPRGSD